MSVFPLLALRTQRRPNFCFNGNDELMFIWIETIKLASHRHPVRAFAFLFFPLLPFFSFIFAYSTARTESLKSIHHQNIYNTELFLLSLFFPPKCFIYREQHFRIGFRWQISIALVFLPQIFEQNALGIFFLSFYFCFPQMSVCQSEYDSSFKRRLLYAIKVDLFVVCFHSNFFMLFSAGMSKTTREQILMKFPI